VKNDGLSSFKQQFEKLGRVQTDVNMCRKDLGVVCSCALSFRLHIVSVAGRGQLSACENRCTVTFRVGHAYLLKCGTVCLEFSLFGKVTERNQVKKPRNCKPLDTTPIQEAYHPSTRKSACRQKTEIQYSLKTARIFLH